MILLQQIDYIYLKIINLTLIIKNISRNINKNLKFQLFNKYFYRLGK